MTTPIRKKRNFKALQLDVAKPPEPPQTASAPVPPPKEPITMPIATRNAPPVAAAANGRRRPPPMVLKDPKLKAAPPAPPQNDENLLTVMSSPNSAPATGSISANSRPGLHTDLTQKLATMDMNAATKLDLRNEDLKELQELGQGNGGSVKKVVHLPSGKIMAKKVRGLLSFSISAHLVRQALYPSITLRCMCASKSFACRFFS